MSKTGRYFVYDFKTGKLEKVVEPIRDHKLERNADWGKTDTTNLPIGGSITEEESIITKENGFDDIKYINAAVVER